MITTEVTYDWNGKPLSIPGAVRVDADVRDQVNERRLELAYTSARQTAANGGKRRQTAAKIFKMDGKRLKSRKDGGPGGSFVKLITGKANVRRSDGYPLNDYRREVFERPVHKLKDLRPSSKPLTTTKQLKNVKTTIRLIKANLKKQVAELERSIAIVDQRLAALETVEQVRATWRKK